jgi:hypothetical protein
MYLYEVNGAFQDTQPPSAPWEEEEEEEEAASI